MKTIQLLIYTYLLIVAVGCEEGQKKSEDITDKVVSTFYFIRHAEKDRSNPDDIDPELNQSGLGRAMHWAEILNEVPLDAIYSTDFERTTMTAAPAAVKQDLTVQYYDPDEIDIAQFKADNAGKNVLIVGHSNSTPEFVNKMLGTDKYDVMDDRDNGSIYIVQTAGEQVTDMRLVFNCNCPD